MKYTLFYIVSIFLSILFSGCSHKSPESAAGVETNPHRIILGGELGNSAATCAEDIEALFPKLKAMNLNTVLVPAYWDLTEPEEGHFDFSLTDKVIDTAKENGMKVVFLWFGAWKNSMSCYSPAWVKSDTDRFPRARTSTGKPLEILSAFSPEVLKADKAAFEAWLKNIKSYDTEATVAMIQIENEIGMLEEARDHSPEAEIAYNKGVPKKLTDHLNQNLETLHSGIARKWAENGNKPEGSWTEVFGDDIFTDEYFMAWNYAIYVEEMAKKAREITDIPLYVNAAMNSRGRMPGEYPSAGPLAHLKDIWHAGAPSIDFLSPDIYDSGFEGWTAQYALPDNRLFIPEARRSKANGAQAYYVFGHHNALGFSPFSIENANEDEAKAIREAYGVLEEMAPLLASNVKEGVLLSQEEPTAVINREDTRITLSHYFTLPWDPRATDGSEWPESGAILIQSGPDEYILAGTGVVAKFEHQAETGSSASLGEDGFLNSGDERTNSPLHGSSPRKGLLSVEEVKVNPDGTLSRVRSFNGDETHQGRHARISVDDHKILRIKTYTYE